MRQSLVIATLTVRKAIVKTVRPTVISSSSSSSTFYLLK